jgi:transcriptional regulator with GAF, ATPase, and Fis domain
MPGFDDAETELRATANKRSTVRRHPRIAWRDAEGDHTATLERSTLVGSAARADLVVNDTTVSRLHAELDPRADGLWVRDLGSRNGTYVEGVQVIGARVPDGGSIQIGDTVIRVEASVEGRVPLWPESRFGPMVGGSAPMRELFATLERVAQLDSTVLVTGETGTGKELVASAIHQASPRADKPFVVVDCAALPEQLLESELFGHARGAFTGATGARAGAIESADGGTVFLDEIGELPLGMQPKLLRALESRTIRRLGETGHRRIDVRFVSATNRDLRSMVNAGGFREDLYFRLAVLPVAVPPLRQRLDDVPLLLEHFNPDSPPEWRREILREVLDRPWLGNVRELRNFVERALAFGTKQAAAMSDLGAAPPVAPPSVAAPSVPPARLPAAVAPQASAFEASFEKPLREFKEELEREYLRRLLARHGGNVTAAAEAAGIDRTYVHRLVRKHEG